MSTVVDLHNKAMDLAELAMFARIRGDVTTAENLNRQALLCEKEAADLHAQESAVEPTRSVLYRSAASLALDCGETEMAERLIIIGLSGEPPVEIADEMKDLFERANFLRHLELKGFVLDPMQMQFSIAGNAISYGMAPADQFINRVTSTKTLLLRTAERRRQRPFRERGRAVDVAKDDAEIFLSTPNAASFAVTFRMGRPQLAFDGMDESVALIDEFLDCLEVFNRGEDTELKQRVGNEAYYRNFVGLVRNIAPDGDDINLVGFTVIRNGQERKVAVTRKRAEVPLLSPSDGSDGSLSTRREVIKGVLRFADALDSNTIKVQDEHNKKHRIIVPEGLLNDIVKPLWNDTVAVEVSIVGREKHLVNIDAVSD